jgi:hypothetical protein
MEKEPQLETGIRNCQLDVVSGCLLDCIRESRVLVDINNAPHFVVSKKRITEPPRLAFCLTLKSDCPLNDGFRIRTQLIDLHVDQTILFLPRKGVEVDGLSNNSFAHDQ